MRRWTDGKSWSASRVSGSFLTYREMEGKRGGSGFAPPLASRGGKTPESGRNSGDDRDMDAEEGPDGYRYKPDGLMKQSFSITTSTGENLHLISYYARSHPNAPGLQQPSTDPNLRSIRPQKGMYPESTLNDQSNVPAVTRSPMVGAPHYVMSPQNSSYARPGATHPQGYVQPGYAPPMYNFPPSPLSTPPNGFPMHQYGPAPSALPPIGTNSPYTVGPYGPQQHQPVSQPPPTFDQRPLRTPDSNLPPPPPLSQYSGNPPPNNPPPYLHGQPPQYGQSPTMPDRASPTQQASAALQIDPRLMGPTASTTTNQSNGSAYPKAEESPAEPKPRENGTAPVSAASQAPTIGALVNTSAAIESDAKSNPKQNGERQGSTSPGGTTRNGAPQDIPSEKLGFREDKRALRQLDKVFPA